MNIQEQLFKDKKIIDKALDRFLPKKSEEPKVLHKAMRYSVFSGGKRMRPLLVIESARVCRANIKDAVIVGCAVELIHTFSLIHDDLPSMDNDDYRRGKLTSHKAFGEANAILAGDALLALAFNIIAKNLDPKLAGVVIKELSDAIGPAGVVGGQVIDIAFKGKRTGARALDRINRLKTARLFESCVKLGAITAGAGAREIRAMAAFGSSIGMAFQIVDDIFDGDGYAKLFGEGRARLDAGELIGKAKKALNIFGGRAEKLKEIADYVLNRTK